MTDPGKINVAPARRFRFRRALMCAASVLVLPVAAGCFAGNRQGNPQTMGNDNMILIDTRTPEEYAAGHLRGAVLIPHTRILAEIKGTAPDRSAKIVLYCRSGRRAETARAALMADGYSDVENLGGLEDAAKKLRIEIVR